MKRSPSFICACINESEVLRADVFPRTSMAGTTTRFKVFYYNQQSLELDGDEMVELLKTVKEKKEKQQEGSEEKESAWIKTDIERINHCIRLVEELKNG